MRILALDPGGTSGIFVWTPDAVYHSQHDVAGTITRLASASGVTAILAEHFAPVRTSNAEPAELIGVARLQAHILGIPFHRYTPAQAKNLAPNRLLARLGWHDPTQPHANDAARLVACYALLDSDPESPLFAQVRAAKMEGEA